MGSSDCLMAPSSRGATPQERRNRPPRERVAGGRAATSGYVGHVHCAPDFLRRSWQIRPVPVARLVTGRDGGPDAGQRADSRGHHGRGRCVSCRARVSTLFVRGSQWRDLLTHRCCLDRSNHGAHGCAHRHCSGGYQAHPRLFNRFATWSNDGFVRRWRCCGGHHALTRPRLFQSAFISRLWFRNSRVPR